MRIMEQVPDRKRKPTGKEPTGRSWAEQLGVGGWARNGEGTKPLPVFLE